MNEEIEFLEYIYQNAKMGQESTARLIKTRNKKDELEDVVKIQYADYKKIANSAKLMIERRKQKVKEIGVMTKIATYVGIKMNVLEDDTVYETAMMLIKGSQMGIEQIKKHLDEYLLKKQSKNVINLANRLLEIEENNINRLKNFIKT